MGLTAVVADPTFRVRQVCEVVIRLASSRELGPGETVEVQFPNSMAPPPAFSGPAGRVEQAARGLAPSGLLVWHRAGTRRREARGGIAAGIVAGAARPTGAYVAG